MPVRPVLAALLVVGLAGVGCAAEAPPAVPPSPAADLSPVPSATQGTGLRILLTDDDGWDAGGIIAMRRALRDAGHDVTLVAPEENRSGYGASSDGATELDEKEPGVFAVDGTSVDAVRAGLASMQSAGGPPDLVVSGTNLGQNSGTGITRSGTVGAAVTAARAGVPAIASSTHGATSEEDCTATADYVARLIAALGPPLFAPGLVINVNYPAGERASEVRLRDPLVVDLDGEEMDVPTEGPESDTDLLDQGIATLAELDADGRPGTPGSVADRLRAVPA